MNLFFREAGNDNSSPVIILHGLFGSSDNWMTFGKALGEKHHVYMIDQRNHGRSPWHDRFDYESMAGDIADFIRRHQIEQPAIIGHSMGGKAAMNLAVNHPDLISRLVIIDIAPKAYPVHHDKILEGLKSLSLDSIQSRGEADKQLAVFIPELGVRQFLLKNLYRREEGGFAWRMNLAVIQNYIENVGEVLQSGAVFDKPALFIRGEHSNYILDEDESIIAEHFPNYRLETIAGAGHWVQAEKPMELMGVLNNFVG